MEAMQWFSNHQNQYSDTFIIFELFYKSHIIHSGITTLLGDGHVIEKEPMCIISLEEREVLQFSLWYINWWYGFLRDEVKVRMKCFLFYTNTIDVEQQDV